MYWRNTKLNGCQIKRKFKYTSSAFRKTLLEENSYLLWWRYSRLKLDIYSQIILGEVHICQIDRTPNEIHDKKNNLKGSTVTVFLISDNKLICILSSTSIHNIMLHHLNLPITIDPSLHLGVIFFNFSPCMSWFLVQCCLLAPYYKAMHICMSLYFTHFCFEVQRKSKNWRGTQIFVPLVKLHLHKIKWHQNITP